jgi:hypothetical protein
MFTHLITLYYVNNMVRVSRFYPSAKCRGNPCSMPIVHVRPVTRAVLFRNVTAVCVNEQLLDIPKAGLPFFVENKTFRFLQTHLWSSRGIARTWNRGPRTFYNCVKFNNTLFVGRIDYYINLSVKLTPRCEISSSHGGEYDVQSCLLGCTAV